MPFFNTAGPCIPGEHYMVPSGGRCGDLRALVEERKFFVIHAPRQTGKTTLIQDFIHQLNADGRYLAIYCSLETAQGIDRAAEGIQLILDELGQAIHESPYQVALPINHPSVTEVTLKNTLKRYCAKMDKPLVIMFDEVDCLGAGTLLSFLRQLRQGYNSRRIAPFVHSLALVGMHNFRDIKVGGVRLGSTLPFNIVSDTLTIRNFNRDELAMLLAQHTDATGQVFSREVADHIYEQTRGQPWLCNAIAREIVVALLNRDYSRTITIPLVKQAIDQMILRRDPHIDSLLMRLKKTR